MPEDPTPGEIMRRLNDVSEQLKDTVKEVREFRNWAERLYVPRGEWVEGRRADQGYTKDVAKDVDELKQKAANDTAFRRQVLLALAIASFSALVSVAIAIVTLVIGR